MEKTKFSLNGMTEIYSEQLNNSLKPNSNVYIVGWRPDSLLWYFDFFLHINCNITLIEIFPNNANSFPKHLYPNVNVICDDVQNYKKYISSSNNILYWGEGPEHLPLSVSKKLLIEMKNYFDTMIIHTPFGEYIQEEMYGNIYETHLSTWYDTDYDELDFKHCRFHGPSHNFDAIVGFWTNLK
jgi:hypothetical protein